MATPYFSTVLLVVASIALFGLAVYNYHATLGLSFEEKNLKDFVTNRVIPQISKDLNSISHQFGEGNIASNVASNVVSNTIGNGNGVPILNTVPAQGLGNPLDSTSSLQSNIKSNLEVPKPHVLQCEHADLVTFWRDPTLADQMYETPYKTNGPTKYVTFEPDVGGWNNIRMQMELVLVFAAATGRTLVLPPDQPMYLLNKGKGHQKEHSFADFFPFDFIKKRVPVITMKEFMSTEAITGRLLHKETKVPTKPPGGRTEFIGTNRDDRNLMWEYLRNVTSCPPWKGMRDFLVIPPRPGLNTSLLPSAEAGDYDKRMNTFAGDKRYGMERHAQFYDTYWHDQHVIHFISKPAWGYRLLEHFYTYIHFQDEAMDRYYKRFVRDFVHYVDLIFCKAAKIMHKLREEGGGKYSAFHVRRGEFQYKNVKIPAAEMLANVGQFIPSDRLVYVATDERKKSFFDAFKTRWSNIKYLDDYMDYAELRSINPNFLGMIDQVICTRGEEFIGTWFSTFTGYITRMRGYMGYPDNTTWYGDKAHRDRFQEYEFPRFPFYMRENSISWFGIEESGENGKDYWEKYFKVHPLKIDDDPWGKKKRKGKGKNKPKPKPKPKLKPKPSEQM